MANPKSRKVHINISLTQEAIDLLGEEAARQDRSRSWIIEWAVKKALAPAAKPQVAGNPVPLTDLQRIAEAQKGRYGEASQLDTDWPDALERSVPPLEFSA